MRNYIRMVVFLLRYGTRYKGSLQLPFRELEIEDALFIIEGACSLSCSSGVVSFLVSLIYHASPRPSDGYC